MMQDNRLLPMSPEALDRPLRDLTQPAPVAAAASTQEPAHLREYLAVVLKRKWLILSLMIVVTSLVAIQMYRLPSQYEAMGTIQIEQKAKSPLTTGRGGEIVIRSNDQTYWNTQLQKLKTQKLARQVIIRLDLQNNPSFLGAGYKGLGVISGLRRIITREKPQQPAQQQDAGAVPVVSDSEPTADQLTPEQARKLEPFEDALRDGLTVTPVERTSLVEIHFQHTDPEIAAKVVNTIAEVFRDNDIASETTGSKKAGEVLANTIIDLQKRISETERQRLDYKQRNNLPLGAKLGQDLTAAQLSAYLSQMQSAEQKRRQTEADYRAAIQTQTSDGVWSIPAVQANKNVQRLREKISDLEERKRALLVTYTEEWPEVKKINEQLSKLNQELKEAPKEVVAGLRTAYESALGEESSARARYNGSRGQANVQSIAETSLADLDQRIETDRQNLNLYMQRANELRVTSYDNVAGNVSMVEEARVPRAPIGPARARNIIIALLLSLGVGVGLAFLLDYLDDTLKSVEDVDRHLHLPTLALIPAPREQRRILGRGHAAPEPGTATALALIDDVRSPVAEAYRHLRTSLLLSSAGQPPRTILVTSSQPSEGKTTTAVNIATMLAQTGAEVLVLDCDLRRPRVHAHFGVGNARGVTNYLSGDANVGDIVQSSERLPNLKVITSGPVPPNAAELLGSDEMRKLLYVLSENFTHIVVDSPPAISFTDASILSTMVDGVMLVVHGGRSSRAVVRRAKQQLQDVGAHIFGIVLNNVKLEGMDYYYSGYYSGYYSEEDAPEGAEVAGSGGGGGGAA
ncbi:MAG TPA: polysaccharide biosynthesis tyrosine autokinase [Pyrinomonadaceae bacterium]|jgi:capsular exopolysaccharide synthesis family protein|nr:polysaccharide biosynthesis tyrosine autokinase [Pyrinomonadaceae bacterium]